MNKEWVEVKKSWFDRICAILFGKKRWHEEEGMMLLFSSWRGVEYLLWCK